MENQINYWGLAHEYATSKYKMEKGDHVSKYERYEEVKEAFEAGFLKAMEFQAERMYSEEEVLEILFELSCNNDTDKEEVEEWFEQFKKKS